MMNLGINSANHGAMTSRMLEKIEEILIKEKPDWVLVCGDTNSTLAGALAAVKLHIPIAHVEAGLRSFNREMPEEHNRVLTDHRHTLLPYPDSGRQSAQGRDYQGVQLVGDVMYDVLLTAVERAQRKSNILESLDLEEKSFLLVTVHQSENTDDYYRLGNIMAALSELAEREVVVLALHPRTRKILDENSSSPLTLYSSLKYRRPRRLPRHAHA